MVKTSRKFLHPIASGKKNYSAESGNLLHVGKHTTPQNREITPCDFTYTWRIACAAVASSRQYPHDSHTAKININFCPAEVYYILYATYCNV